MKPLVLEYLKHMGYTETYAKIAEKEEFQQKSVKRKNTIDDG